jgi:hypothetical protein
MIYLLTAWPISNSFITRTPAIPAAKAVPGLPQSVAACMFLLRSQSRTARIMGAWPCQARYLRSEIERICVSRPPAALNPPAPEGRDQSSAGRSAAGLDAARHRQHVAGDRLRKPIAATKSKSLADELARRPNLAAARETLAGVRRSGPREDGATGTFRPSCCRSTGTRRARRASGSSLEWTARDWAGTPRRKVHVSRVSFSLINMPRLTCMSE